MFIVVMLCNDDGDYFVDHITRPFSSKSDAEEAIKNAIKDEIDGLTDCGKHDTDVYTVKDGNEVQKNGVLLTKYEILGIEDTCVKDNLVSHPIRINPDYVNVVGQDKINEIFEGR